MFIWKWWVWRLKGLLSLFSPFPFLFHFVKGKPLGPSYPVSTQVHIRGCVIKALVAQIVRSFRWTTEFYILMDWVTVRLQHVYSNICGSLRTLMKSGRWYDNKEAGRTHPFQEFYLVLPVIKVTWVSVSCARNILPLLSVENRKFLNNNNKIPCVYTRSP